MRLALLLAGALLSICVTVGLYDWLTWGSPFRSAIRFAHLTLVEPDFASRVKYQSPLWYATNLLRWLAPTLLPLFWFARRRVPWLFLVVPFVALSLVKHKELRYTQSMIPFVAVAAAIGASMLWSKRRALAIVLVALSLVWNLAGIRTFARKSQPAVLAAQWLASQHVQRLVTSQLWAYGDRLYLGTTMDLTDLGSPPQVNAAAIARADAVALWETDLDHAELTQALAANGFHALRTFRDGPARPVVVFTIPRESAGSGRAGGTHQPATASLPSTQVLVPRESAGSGRSAVRGSRPMRATRPPRSRALARDDGYSSFRYFGSSASMRPSPRKLRPITASMMAAPGK